MTFMSKFTRPILLLGSVAIIGLTFIFASPDPIALDRDPQSNELSFGAIEIQLSPETPDPQILTPHTINTVVGAFELTSHNERIQVDTLTFRNCVENPGGGCIGGAFADDLVETIKLRYPNRNGEVQTVTTQIIDDAATFQNLDLLLLPEDPALVTLVNDLAPSATSGAQLQWVLDAQTGPLHAHALSSGVEITEASLEYTVASAPITVRGSQPVIQDAGQNRFSISSEGNAELNSFTIAIDTTDQESNWSTCAQIAESFTFIWNGEPVDGTWTAHTMSGSVCSEQEPAAYVSFRADDPLTLSSTPVQAEVSFTPRRETASGDNIALSLPFQEQLSALRFKLNAITWTDGIVGEIDGSYVQSLPVFWDATAF